MNTAASAWHRRPTYGVRCDFAWTTPDAEEVVPVRMHNRHERVIAAQPEPLGALIADFDAIWPTRIAPAPRPLGDRLYEAPPMIWEEVERTGAARAFRVVRPEELQAEHWFELHPVDGGTLVRHTVEGEALRDYAAIWRDRIEPRHDLVIEALLDNIESAVA